MRRLPVLVLLSLLSVTACRGGGEAPVYTAECAPTSCDELVAKAHQQGSVRILVQVAIPGGWQPEGYLSPEQVEQQRQAIAETQDRVLQRLPLQGVLEVHKFKYVPGMAMAVTPAALTALLSDPEVTHVHEDIAVSVPAAAAAP